MGSFVLTYLLHSTAFLGLALLAVRLRPFHSPHLRDLILRVALLAGLGTALLGPHVRPALPVGHWAPPVVTVQGPQQPESRTPINPHAATTERTPTRAATPPALPVDGGAALLLVGALFALLRFGAAVWHIRRRHAGPVQDATLEARATQYAGRRVQLSHTRLAVPCAVGTRHILLPGEIEKRLHPSELDAVLAHECAHLRRRDPLWTAGLSLLTHLLWFQPLNWLALREWRAATEEQCDAWAAQHAPRLTLARALLTLARAQASPGPAALLLSPAVRTPPLSRRIHALLDPKEFPMNRRHLPGLLLLPVLLGAALPPVALAGGREGVRTVVIDAAHGGGDPGAVGEVRESEVVLAIALRVRAQLERQGVNVVLTRGDDTKVSLPDRIKRVPASADALVSIHLNSSDDRAARGIEAYSASPLLAPALAARSQRLSEAVLGGLVAATGAPGRPVTPEMFYMVAKSPVPATLIEVGFVSNTQEAQALGTAAYQDKVAQGIARGLLNYR